MLGEAARYISKIEAFPVYLGLLGPENDDSAYISKLVTIVKHGSGTSAMNCLLIAEEARTFLTTHNNLRLASCGRHIGNYQSGSHRRLSGDNADLIPFIGPSSFRKTFFGHPYNNFISFYSFQEKKTH